MDTLPLLIFPPAKRIEIPSNNNFIPKKIHFPDHDRQETRLQEQMDKLQSDFNRFKASISASIAGMEPETVIVIETIGSVDKFHQAVAAVDGLEWMGEWDLDPVSPDDDFYFTEEGKKNKPLEMKLYLSMSNERGLQELLSLWKKWKNKEKAPRGKAKWRDVFKQIRTIRRWGIEEILRETGMEQYWREKTKDWREGEGEEECCQIEIFFRQDEKKRGTYQANITRLVENINGKIVGDFLCLPEIAFHAVKVKLKSEWIQTVLDRISVMADGDTGNQLLAFPGLMGIRPSGQNFGLPEMEERVEPVEEEAVGDLPLPGDPREFPPVAAILDGVPNCNHQWLKGRILLDDPDNLAETYQPGERKHGTCMASLLTGGDRDGPPPIPLKSQIYFIPVMQRSRDEKNKSKGKEDYFFNENFPGEIFWEDRIHRAVRRMFDGSGSVPAQAPGVKIINFSMGDTTRPLKHEPSSMARLLDWLSWKYRVLFCVSAGNCGEKYNLSISPATFASREERIHHVLQHISDSLFQRRLISPAESINAITVGALNRDERKNDMSPERNAPTPDFRDDLLPDDSLFSPVSRLGLGFRRSVKPEIFFPGGKQLYEKLPGDASAWKINTSIRPPGLRSAWETNDNVLSHAAYTRGTSNACALASRAAVLIHQTLEEIGKNSGQPIHDHLMAVLIKTLLVHGAVQDPDAIKYIKSALKGKENNNRFKEMASRFLGYGAVDIGRVLACADQRGTIIGCDFISEKEVHEYRIPLPPSLSERKIWRRLIVTLAWFSPINPAHSRFRKAKLALSPKHKWDENELMVKRTTADDKQTQRGTVQHEVLEGEKKISAFQDGDALFIRVQCKKDACEKLDDQIPYGVAVTLEVGESVGIPVYQEIRDRLRLREAVQPHV